MAKIEIATIGYEGTDIADFVSFLSDLQIDVLYDVRELPSSRKRGFSKNGLASTLEEIGIEYIHSRSLGDPKPGRDAARRGDYKEFERVFRSHLSGDQAVSAFDELVEVASEKFVCLMCYERDPNTCHRNILIEKILIDHNFKVTHLGVPENYLKNRGRFGDKIGNREPTNHIG